MRFSLRATKRLPIFAKAATAIEFYAHTASCDGLAFVLPGVATIWEADTSALLQYHALRRVMICEHFVAEISLEMLIRLVPCHANTVKNLARPENCFLWEVGVSQCLFTESGKIVPGSRRRECRGNGEYKMANLCVGDAPQLAWV